MFAQIIKRDGSHAEFKQEKITLAIHKALIANYPERTREALAKLAEVIADRTIYALSKRQLANVCLTVEEVQDTVEETLMDVGERQAAKRYIRYRLQHEDIRHNKKSFVDAQKLVLEYVGREDWRVNENANMDFSLQGLNNHVIAEVTKGFWLHQLYPPEVRDAHNGGDFHLHDLGLLAPYCCGWSFEDLLKLGFRGVPGKVASAPPRHFRTALGQLVNFFYTLQGEAAGAQAVSSFDTYLAPFVRHDNLSYKDVRQGIQEFVYNLNVPTRVGFQTPFVNLTMDLVCPSTLATAPAIIGGELQESCYGDFQAEMDMINLAFCDVMMQGDASGRIFTFPIPTYNVTKEFRWDSPVVDAVMEMTARYGIPYFANFINSDMSPEDARSMCCRLRLDNRELRKRGGGLFGANPLTGSIGVVTINLARLGFLASSEEEFLARLYRLMDLAKSSLDIKRKVLEKNTVLGLYPYSKFYLHSVRDRFGLYWKNHFSTIGINGMNEAIVNLCGTRESIATPSGQAFALRVLEYMRRVLADYQEETGDLYNLEATPAEGTAYRLAKLDRAAYATMVIPGVNEPYYTNSTQLPVGHTSDMFDALDLQEALQSRYTGGTVFHGFLGEAIDDVQACKGLVRKVLENYRLPYFTISPTFSVCDEHGYLRGEQASCPVCGRQAEIWTRVVGFHRPVQNWNLGKKEEYKDRLEFALSSGSAAND
ncbi:MAG: Anaerobic ribonucleoside-triphosphate reductase [Firmicutes bacterium]|nr:Anaerobic ribonucleoside-triphosphate reductase [Bacillota bacterium]